MAFCVSCGKELEDGALFCEHCGAPQEQPVAAAPAAAPQSSPFGAQPVASPFSTEPAGDSPWQPAAGGGEPPAPRKPLPKGVKIAIIAVAAVVAAIALLMFILGKANAPEKTISSFINSIVTQDYAAFSKATNSASEDLELTEETVAPFLALYSGRTGTLEDYQSALQSDLRQLEKGLASTGNGFIRLVEHNNILFKSYSVEITGRKYSFTAPLDNTQVTVGPYSLTLNQAERSQSLLMLPGKYQITATCTDSLLGEKYTTTLEDYELSGSDSGCYLNMDYSTIYIQQPDMDLSGLTVNGVKVDNINFDGAGEYCLAPLPKEFELVAEFTVGGATLTDTYTHSGDYTWDYFYPEPQLTPELSQSMLDQVAEYMKGWVSANNNGSLDALNALNYNENSPVLNDVANRIKDNVDDPDNRYEMVYSIQEMAGNLDWNREYGYEGLCFSTLVDMKLYYTYNEYWSGEIYWNGEDTMSRVYKVYLMQENGEWVVQNCTYYSYYSNFSNLSSPYVMVEGAPAV